MKLIEQLSRVYNKSAQNFIHLLFTTCSNVESKRGKEKFEYLKTKYIYISIDPQLLSYLTRSLVRLSTNHIEIIANEIIQLRHLLSNTSLNDDVRVR